MLLRVAHYMTDSSPNSLPPHRPTRQPHPAVTWLKQHQSRALLWLRLIVSVILMALVMSLVLDDREKLRDVNWDWIPLAWLLMLTSTVVKALRWSLLVRVLRLLAGTLMVAGLATALAVVIYAISLDTTVREKFEDYGLDARAFSGLKIAAVGEKTAESLLAWGLRADLVPDVEHLMDLMTAEYAQVCTLANHTNED